MAAAAVACRRKRPLPHDADAGGNCPRRSPSVAADEYAFRSIDEYEMMEEIGRGSSGVVFRALDRATGETVAVKSARTPGLDHAVALLREAGRLAAGLGHPSVVQVRDLALDVRAPGTVYLVMEHVGPDLRARLRQGRVFSQLEARRAMRQLLSAARELHEGAGIVHRDVKPGNILVGARGEVKLCDFGAAGPVPARNAPSPPSYPQPRVGTLLYRAPEQLSQSNKRGCYGPGVDLWALGCVMAELLTGEPLFGSAGDEDELLVMALQMRDHVTAAGPDAFGGLTTSLSAHGRDLLRGLLRFDPEERLTAAEALDHPWFAAKDDEAPNAAVAEAEQQQQCRGSAIPVSSAV